MDPKLMDDVSRLEVILSSQDVVPPKGSNGWNDAVENAKAVIELLDSAPRARNSLGVPRWVNLVGLLQKLAFVDPDGGAEPDIAAWCERQWADVLKDHPHNVAALQGLGHAWLLKCQRVLAQIYNSAFGSQSQGDIRSSRARAVRALFQTGGVLTSQDAQRLNSAIYVEARALLRPSLESFDRAVEAASLQGAMTGNLLELAAEAYITFGNVSNPRNNEICYRKALGFLQQARDIEGYNMDPYLRSYLQDNLYMIE